MWKISGKVGPLVLGMSSAKWRNKVFSHECIAVWRRAHVFAVPVAADWFQQSVGTRYVFLTSKCWLSEYAEKWPWVCLITNLAKILHAWPCSRYKDPSCHGAYLFNLCDHSVQVHYHSWQYGLWKFFLAIVPHNSGRFFIWKWPSFQTASHILWLKEKVDWNLRSGYLQHKIFLATELARMTLEPHFRDLSQDTYQEVDAHSTGVQLFQRVICHVSEQISIFTPHISSLQLEVDVKNYALPRIWRFLEPKVSSGVENCCPQLHCMTTKETESSFTVSISKRKENPLEPE